MIKSTYTPTTNKHIFHPFSTTSVLKKPFASPINIIRRFKFFSFPFFLFFFKKKERRREKKKRKGREKNGERGERKKKKGNTTKGNSLKMTTPYFWRQPLQYLRWASHEKPAIFYSIAIGSLGPLTLIVVPPIRHRFGDGPRESIPLTYPGMS